MEEYTSASRYTALYGIGNMQGRLADEPYISVHSSVISEVELSLLLAGREVLIIAVVCLYGDYTTVACLHAL